MKTGHRPTKPRCLLGAIQPRQIDVESIKWLKTWGIAYMERVERAYNMAQEWMKWLDTRRFYAPPEKKNILARLQGGGTSRGEPNAAITPEMVAFNLAVTGLPMKKFVAFVVVYCGYRPSPIKVLAHENGVNPSNFYGRAHKAAHEAMHVTDRLTELSKQMRAELYGVA